MKLPASSIIILGMSFQVAVAGTLYVDDDASSDPGPGDPLVSDPSEDGSIDHPFDSIQEAINAVVTGVDNVIVRAGTYRSIGNVNVDFLGKAFTLRAESGANNTIVDCQDAPLTRGFVFQNGEFGNTVLDGFTVMRGNMNGASPAQQRGGAVYCEFTGPTIRNCTLTGNVALEGGAIGLNVANPLLVRCRVRNNTAIGDGGGLYNVDGYPVIANTEFRNNHAGGSGGGMYHFSCSFGDGPAPVLVNTVVADNVAQIAGGGISSIFVCNTVVLHSTIVNNSAATGGGIEHAEIGLMTVANSIIWGNAPDAFDNANEFQPPTVLFSNIQGGHPGEGNTNIDPQFVNAANGDFRLTSISPLIDAGNANPHFDIADLDGDSVFAEPLPVDLDENERLIGLALDMGAYESPLGIRATPTTAQWALVTASMLMLSSASIAMRIPRRNTRRVTRET